MRRDAPDHDPKKHIHYVQKGSRGRTSLHHLDMTIFLGDRDSAPGQGEGGQQRAAAPARGRAAAACC